MGVQMVTWNDDSRITSRRIADMFVGAVEGGSTYWCDHMRLLSPGDQAPDDPHKGVWYDNPRHYENPDLRIRVVDDVAEPDGHIITQETIKKGLEKMAKDYDGHFR